MNDTSDTRVVLETEADPADLRRLKDLLYDFNAEATGIADGKLLAAFVRDKDGAVAGGVYGWTWGETCYVRYLLVPAALRNQGHGTRLMRAVEAEARRRGCTQVLLETHDFQAPAFYRRLGFEVAARIEGYPRGHSLLTMVKRLAAPVRVRTAGS
jgi:ribosomal protein S18 acetylase RimI-like enzyme